MPERNLIAIGGSAGSFEALATVLNRLQPDLPAAVVVVVHMPATQPSHLARVLSSRCPLPVNYAAEGLRIAPGNVYVAVPDRHIVIARDHLHLTRGPKEGLHRPSINVTFRSAAAAYGDKVVGVLLSGMLDDGAGGLWDIVKNDGIAIVQHPEEAQFPSMPNAALRDVAVHYQLRSNEIGPMLNQLVRGMEVSAVSRKTSADETAPEKFSGFTCPECHGPLYEKSSQIPEFRCRVGHGFSLPSLLEESTSTQERKMYEAIVALEEGADLARYAAARPQAESPEQLKKEAEQLRRHAAAIRKLLEERTVSAD